MPALSTPVRILVLFASVAVLVVSAVVAPASAALPLFVKDAKPDWALFGFEVVTAAAAVLGVLQGLGHFRSGPGLGLACVAGTVLVAGVLGWKGANGRLGGFSLTPMLAVHVGAGLALGAAGAWAVLSRRPGALWTAARGALLILPVAVVVGGLASRRGMALADRVLSASQSVQFIVVSVGFLAATALVAAGAHLVIRAFEMGRGEAPPTSRPERSV